MAVRNIGDGRPAARARLAARHAERLYPGPLGRLVAHELLAYAESAPPDVGGLAASVVTEVLDRTPPAAALLPSSELQRASRRAS
ncbi:MAG: hypothetical protein QOK35_2006 [Pseudonocardiales bacterium]|nr:hypothetical protein [Pseudonocardiales bacterium]